MAGEEAVLPSAPLFYFTVTAAGNGEAVGEIFSYLSSMLEREGVGVRGEGRDDAPVALVNAGAGQENPARSSLLILEEGISEEAVKRLLRTLPFGQKHLAVKRGETLWRGRCDIVVARNLPAYRKASRGFKFRFRWIDDKHLWSGTENLAADKRLRLTMAAKAAHEMGVPGQVIKEMIAENKRKS